MTIKEAIMLLNPKTTASALAEIEYYNGFSGKEACIEAIEDACRLAIEALEKQIEYRNRIKSLVDTIENVCKLCRERHTDDEHCGLCEYDGAYQGESGDWVNECPGFDKDDCFELSREFKNKYIDWEDEE